MPIPIANNAVTHGTVGGEYYVYSFGGIDSTKSWAGITKRSFRYHVLTDTWEEIDTLPAALENVAAGASTVNNKIYILGGYHVYSNGNEISSNEVIIYNPETDTYEPNGSPIPVAIDDHVQCVWRDSLIFVITGWSNNTNVPNVQIYDPALDQWTVGTQTPNDNYFKAFGASGQIIGDTIYYFGGASLGWNFPARSYLRKGIIDENDPTQITWTQEEDGPNANYRAACLRYNTDIFWVGGSEISYNYNGIAYNGSGGVPPLFQISRYVTEHLHWYQGSGAPYGVMDLRGIAQISSNQWIICGGMKENQKVSNRTFLLELDPAAIGLKEFFEIPFQLNNRTIESQETIRYFELYDLNGKLIHRSDSNYKIPEKFHGNFILKVQFDHSGTMKKIFI